jgi:hypothetical protein
MEPKQFKTLGRVIAALALIALFVSLIPGTAIPVRAAAGEFTRVSVSSSEAEGNAYSRDPDISADGRYVVFWSGANNLVAGDTNDWEDLFLRDLQTGETTRISVSSSGTQADNSSYLPAISGDGRYIAFNSDATNLVSGDTNGFTDVFLHDRQTGTTTRISVSPSGAQADGISDSYVAISSNGRYIAFRSDATNLVSGDTNGVSDVFVYDRMADMTERVSLDSNEVQGNGGSFSPSISADGRYVAFSSGASNLVSGDANARTDIFVRDRQAGETRRVSINSSGVEADRGASDAAISGDGRFVTFSSEATNLLPGGEEPYGYPHVYLHDRQTGATTLASIDVDGYQMVGWAENPDISADGRYVAFDFDDRGDGIGFTAIYIHDRLTGTTTRVSGPGGGSEDSSFGAAITADGRFVAFSSFNNSLVPNDTNNWNDVFRLELAITSPTIKTYQSIAAYDGWVIESGEDTETGIRIDERASTFFLGDANNDQQYRSILHFGTGSLPNNAIISNVTLKIKKQGIVGTNPFTTHGNILVDVRRPYFDTAVDLQAADFQAPADRTAAGIIESEPGALWYTATLDASAFSAINLAGTTQFRLRFALDDNDDNDQDYVKFYSGDAASGDQPVLTIDYYLPSTDSPAVVGILRADADPTSASSVQFTVAFSEAVTGVDVTDFDLTITGGISGASVQSVSGSGDTYTVTVATGTGSGTIRLDLVDDNSILDQSNNPLSGSGKTDGSYRNGEVYTLNRNNDADTTGVFRPSNGLLYLKNQNTTGFADIAINYGIPGDYPVVGDWDGNGDATIGVYRSGKFYLRNSNTLGFADWVFAFGQIGDQPVAGDWDGDGVDTIGVYRPSTGQFLLRNSNSAGAADMSFYLGNVGDVGIAGDWDGDGKDTTGVFRPINGIIFLKNTNTTGFADVALNYGIPGDKPVTGDWNTDGIDTIGVYRNGQFMLRNSNTIGFADIVFGLGNPGDMPIAGNWDGLP